jgi:hypothetical protein
MRRLFTVALLGLAVATVSTEASAQGRPGGRGRGGVADTARIRRMDSLRVARGDTAFRRRGPDSLRQHRLDSLRAAGVIDTNRAGRGRGRGPGDVGPEGRGRGPGGRGVGPMAGRGPALMGIQLNDAEKASLKTINEKYRAQFEQLREANKGSAPGQNAELAAKAKAIADAQEAEIRGALSSEHQAQFDANVAKMKERGANGRRGRRPPPPAALRDR